MTPSLAFCWSQLQWNLCKIWKGILLHRRGSAMHHSTGKPGTTLPQSSPPGLSIGANLGNCSRVYTHSHSTHIICVPFYGNHNNDMSSAHPLPSNSSCCYQWDFHRTHNYSYLFLSYGYRFGLRSWVAIGKCNVLRKETLILVLTRFPFVSNSLFHKGHHQGIELGTKAPGQVCAKICSASGVYLDPLRWLSAKELRLECEPNNHVGNCVV